MLVQVDPSLSNCTPMDLLNATVDFSLCMRHLLSLACLSSVCSTPSLLFSLAPTLQSSSSSFLSFQMQSISHRFICVELHGEEYSVTFSKSIGMELDSEGFIVLTCTEQ